MRGTTRATRRHFRLDAAAAADAGAAAGRTALPDFAAWKDPEATLVHSDLEIETEREAFGTSIVTPSEAFFVRNHLPAPDADRIGAPEAWQVAFEGVAEPRRLSLAELRTMDVETVAVVLQCSGNGRAFFEHGPAGSKWSVGAAGCALWSGVPVRALVAALGGVAGGKRFMTSLGGEVLPDGVDVEKKRIERSVPKEAMEHALLAWEMNGAPIPLANGGPLRLIVPGYYACNNIKYVKRVAFTEQESASDIQQSAYRLQPLGAAPDPSQPTTWRMSVKSWITFPHMDPRSGRVAIHGVAFGGIEAVESVEISTDGGASWRKARFLGPDLGRFAWRPFVLMVDLGPGTHRIASRARDRAGNVQPETVPANEHGYVHNGWRAHAVDVTRP